MIDLYHATRDELIRLYLAERDVRQELEARVARQDQEIAQLRQAVALLTEQLGQLTRTIAETPPDDHPPGAPHGMPGHKPTHTSDREPRPRTKRARGYGRSRMAPTVRITHALAHCPDCGVPLAGGTPKRTREVLDLPPPRLVVREHVYLERQCPNCGKRCVPAPDLGGEVTGQGRIGHGVTSLLAVLREEARLPIRVIQSLLQTLSGLHLSVGAIVAASQRVATRAQPVVAAIAATIRASPAVHLDETGWRENGRNGFIWTASTSAERVFLHGTRQKAMVDRLLGETFAGVVISDFYTAYTGDDRIHQYCWAHLLRDIHDLTTRQPQDPVLLGWAAAVHALFQRAQAGATGPPRPRRALRRAVQAELTQLCTPWAAVDVPHRTLCVRMLKHLPDLFTFVTNPAVPPTNNAAERSLRHLVVVRKISGGARSPTGTATRMTLASLFGTWRVQGINPYDACRDLLASPQV